MTITPRQAYEVARLLDRTGDGLVAAHDGVVTVLVDVYGTGSPSLALELDADGEVIARQLLSLHHRDAEDDGLDDFGEEEPLPYRIDLSQARPAPRCECPAPRHDDGTCGICGRRLPVEAAALGLQLEIA
jgi:hypothetical protein